MRRLIQKEQKTGKVNRGGRGPRRFYIQLESRYRWNLPQSGSIRGVPDDHVMSKATSVQQTAASRMQCQRARTRLPNRGKSKWRTVAKHALFRAWGIVFEQFLKGTDTPAMSRKVGTTGLEFYAY